MIFIKISGNEFRLKFVFFYIIMTVFFEGKGTSHKKMSEIQSCHQIKGSGGKTRCSRPSVNFYKPAKKKKEGIR